MCLTSCFSDDSFRLLCPPPELVAKFYYVQCVFSGQPSSRPQRGLLPEVVLNEKLYLVPGISGKAAKKKKIGIGGQHFPGRKFNPLQSMRLIFSGKAEKGGRGSGSRTSAKPPEPCHHRRAHKSDQGHSQGHSQPMADLRTRSGFLGSLHCVDRDSIPA